MLIYGNLPMAESLTLATVGLTVVVVRGEDTPFHVRRPPKSERDPPGRDAVKPYACRSSSSSTAIICNELALLWPVASPPRLICIKPNGISLSTTISGLCG
jgi:hypothetical protein